MRTAHRFTCKCILQGGRGATWLIYSQKRWKRHVTLTELAVTFPWWVMNVRCFLFVSEGLLCLTDVLPSAFQSFLSLKPLILVGWTEFPPCCHLSKPTWWWPQTEHTGLKAESHRARAKAAESETCTLLLQSQRDQQHCLAGINELAEWFLANATAALAQPTASAQPALVNTERSRVSAVVKHRVPIVWKHQFQTTDSHKGLFPSEKVFSVLISVSHPTTISEQLKSNKPERNKFKTLKNSVVRGTGSSMGQEIKQQAR